MFQKVAGTAKELNTSMYFGQKENRIKIRELAMRTIGAEGIDKAKFTTSWLESEDVQKEESAAAFLISLFSDKNKRPLMYLRLELSFGHRLQPRYVAYNLGMYVEAVARFLRRDIRKKKPLGSILYLLREELPEELARDLKAFNTLFWANAKHLFDPNAPEDDHFYSIEDIVLGCLIAAKLADGMILYSPTAKAYINNQIDIGD